MLYVLTASNYILGIITIPYLTRVLGAELYGVVGFGQAVGAYVQLVMDFGFLLSATATVANFNGDRAAISREMSAVMVSKTLLLCACMLVLVVACAVVPRFGEQWHIIMLFGLYAAANAYLPDYVYRGMEMMSAITLRTVIVKTVFACCIFLFVHGPMDVLMVPTFYLLGSLLAIIIAYVHLAYAFGIHPVSVRWPDTVKVLKQSSGFFLSRIASTLYSTLNTVVVGIVYPAGPTMGWFSAVGKAVGAAKGVSSPVADSMYPYMIRTANYRLLIRVSLAGTALLAAGCAVLFVFAEFFCIFFFGEEYAAAAIYLRILIPTIPITLISYLYGFPALTPLGLADFANKSVVWTAALQVALLALLWLLGNLSVVGICCITLISETFLALLRVCAFSRSYRKISKG